jgi:deazaflavin-dependent oxidoreductase (nitroreductase family)
MPAPQQQSRPLLGLRRRPGRLMLGVFRLPLHLYRRGWGWMLGRTFLLLVHIGRKTGKPHDIVAMVLGDDAETGELVICSAWGPDADWIHNLRSRPAREVRIGRECFVPQHRFLTEDEALTVGIAFRQRHPRRLWLLSTILGWGDLRRDNAVREFVRGHPFVALRPPTDEKSKEALR